MPSAGEAKPAADLLVRPVRGAALAAAVFTVTVALVCLLHDAADLIPIVVLLSVPFALVLVGWFLFEPSWPCYVACCVTCAFGWAVEVLPVDGGASLGELSPVWENVGLALLCISFIVLVNTATLGWVGFARKGAQPADGSDAATPSEGEGRETE